jgi:small subunit ribosomal protein S5
MDKPNTLASNNKGAQDISESSDDRNRNRRRPRAQRQERVKPEFDQKLLDIRRVTRVVAGGRRFTFSVVLAIGNRKATVGVGIGKAADTALAIDKAFKNAKKNSVLVNVTSKMSIQHDVFAKYASARIQIMPAPGRGLVAGSAARNIFELGGLTDLSSKILTRSKNKLNIARATLKALQQL